MGRPGRTEEISEVVKLYVENIVRNSSCWRNGLRTSRSTFKKTMKQELKRYLINLLHVITRDISQRLIYDPVSHLRWISFCEFSEQI